MSRLTDVILGLWWFLSSPVWPVDGVGPTLDNYPRYRNLYGTKDFDGTTLENILGAGIGVGRFLAESAEFLRQQQPDMTPPDKSLYDFIVVGAGTAGATVASRLSEMPGRRVLLLEAGPDEELIMDVPVLVGFLQPLDQLNWKYRTEPSDRYCRNMEDKRCNWPRGRVMGGSSVLNYMIATRASPADYDRWAELGNDGWSFDEVLEYFKRLENVHHSPELRADKKYRGTGGPVNVSHMHYRTPLAEAFLRAGEELGFPYVDYNGQEMIGFSPLQLTTVNGMRVSSNRAYLVGRRPRNLRVSKGSLVRRVLFDNEGKRAVGVEFEKYGKRIRVYARMEVILCAGSIGSAQILMLSGIGPGEDLRELGIPVIREAPVGRNLMDHIAYGGLTFTIDEPATLRVADILNITAPYIKDYLLYRQGPTEIPGGPEAIAFLDVDQPDKRSGRPNMELLFISGSIFGIDIITKNLGIDGRTRESTRQLLDTHSWAILPMILQPKSRGWIKLRSNDPRDKPIIVANYLSEPEDIRILIKGIRYAVKIGQTAAMQRHGSKLYRKPLPGCEEHQFDTDDYWLCHLRAITMTIYHYAGTCRMGPVNDTTAVVDPKLRVIGVKGLRVVDASIMPELVSGHPNIPVYMIAEKAADMIKQAWP